MYNPNDIAKPNGHFFGFPYEPEESDIMLLPVPWDVTTSYKQGTAKGPKAILEASLQMDFFDFNVENAWETRIGTAEFSDTIVQANKTYRKLSEKIIKDLERGKEVNTEDLDAVNKACEVVNNFVYQKSKAYLNQNKLVGLVGGDHSTPLGYLRALAEKHANFGILHLDAHADLRIAYEGFVYSHASIMYNALQLDAVKSLVQVGIRDISPDEMERVNTDERIVLLNDYALKEAAFSGFTWQEQCSTIIKHLPDHVYISFDIDSLSPDNCPNTGTPVPGGLSFNEAMYLLKMLRESGKTVIGFDLCEVAQGDDEWDANVGARVLYQLCLCFPLFPQMSLI